MFTITWGSDYAGYINQAKSIYDGNLSQYIEDRFYLIGLSENQKDPVYTPFGFPLLILSTFFLHNWNLLILKVVTPISLLAIFVLSLKIFKRKKYTSLLVLPVFNPWIIDQFRELTTELPALVFLCLGFSNKKFRHVYFIISFLIRPSYLLFIGCFYFIDLIKSKKIIEISKFILLLTVSILIPKLFYKVNVFGYYQINNSEDENFNYILNNVVNFNFESIEYVIYEFGRLTTLVSHPINLFVGCLLILVLIYFRNVYSLMVIVFILFHIFWPAPSYVRLFIPLIFLTIFGLIEYLNIYEVNLNNKMLSISIVLLLSIFSTKIYHQINILDMQRGPYEVESQELFDFLVQNFNEEIVSFHSPRVLTLFTNFNSYKFTSKFVENTVIVCEIEKSDCAYPDGYKSIYKNKKYEVYK